MKTVKKCHPEKIVSNLTVHPGVYQMLDKFSRILYIGKARNLKYRLRTYFNKRLPVKTAALMKKVCYIETIVTANETEALLLENNLIKTHKPRYNILLKDDKSYPYIRLSKHQYPALGFYRGRKRKDSDYFGPFTSAALVKDSIHLLKTVFRIRTCSDSVYRHRLRPCLEYQLNLCSAPCVKYINVADYKCDIEMMRLFLAGKSQAVISNIASKMRSASAELNFELATHYRNQLQQLNKIQGNLATSIDNTDIIAITKYIDVYCIQVLFMRNNRQVGQRSFYPRNPTDAPIKIVLSAFLTQYYLDKTVPKTIVLNQSLDDKFLLEKALNTKILINVKQEKRQLLIQAQLNADIKAEQYWQKVNTQIKQLQQLKQYFNLNMIPKRIECFDISHHAGEATVASVVVFYNGKPQKADYRLFNIGNIVAGDDYAAIKQALSRRYKRLKKQSQSLPNLIFIDGGLGQLNQALSVTKELHLTITVVGIAKGEGRKAGLETLLHISSDGELQKIKLNPQDKTLMFVNYIRDEAHRFAISAHRAKMRKRFKTSILENISGIGVKKRQAILNYFGGIIGVKNASIVELTRISGINNNLAKKIYHHLRQ